MTPDEARSVLGVGPDADPAEIRTAYRRLLRRHHPDVAGEAATSAAARVIEAYAAISAPAPTPSGARNTRPTSTPPTDPASDAPSPPRPWARGAPEPGTTIPLPAPTLDVLEALCEAADVLGDLSYVDRQSGILETIVRWDGWPVCSLLVTLRQHGPDTLAQCELESLDGRPGPPITRVVQELRRIMAALAE